MLNACPNQKMASSIMNSVLPSCRASRFNDSEVGTSNWNWWSAPAEPVAALVILQGARVADGDRRHANRGVHALASSHRRNESDHVPVFERLVIVGEEEFAILARAHD